MIIKSWMDFKVVWDYDDQILWLDDFKMEANSWVFVTQQDGSLDFDVSSTIYWTVSSAVDVKPSTADQWFLMSLLKCFENKSADHPIPQDRIAILQSWHPHVDQVFKSKIAWGSDFSPVHSSMNQNVIWGPELQRSWCHGYQCTDHPPALIKIRCAW